MKRLLTLFAIAAAAASLYAATLPTSPPAHSGLSQGQLLGYMADYSQRMADSSPGVATLPAAAPVHSNIGQTQLLGYIADNLQTVAEQSPTALWSACVAATDDTITCAAHGRSLNAPVRFRATSYPATTGGALSAVAIVPNRPYFVRDVTTNTFKIAEYVGAAAVDITSAGSGVFVDLDSRQDRYLPTGNNGAIQVQAADSTALGGNARGLNALDLQAHRTAADQVAAPTGSIILTGFNNKISSGGGAEATFYGAYSGILTGHNNTLIGNARGSGIIGHSNTVSGSGSTVMFVGGMLNSVYPGSGGTSTVLGDQHLGGGQNVTFLGGFHSLANTVGTTDYGTSGAQIGATGSGTIINYLGGFNMVAMGAGAVAEVQGSRAFVSHGNKNKGFLDLTVQYSSSGAASGTVAAGATSTVEMLPMGYYSGGNLKKFGVLPNRVYTVEFEGVLTLVDATTPLYGIIRKRASYFTGTTANGTPSLIGTVTTIETSGSNAGALPDVAWNLVITPEAGTLTFDATLKNTSGAGKNIHAIAYVHSTWIATNSDT